MTTRAHASDPPPAVIEATDPYPYMYGYYATEDCLAMFIGSVGANPVPEQSVAPVLSTLAPATGVVTGPAGNVTITGTGFDTNTKVTFDGVATPATYLSATQLRINVAPATAGLGAHNVVATNEGKASNSLPYTVTAT